MFTVKEYYNHPFLTKLRATVVSVDAERGVVFDKTVAFPEGGGQEGDRGMLVSVEQEDLQIPFVDTQKGTGRPIFLDNFPVIQVENPIYHKVSEEHLQHFAEGKEFFIQIDAQRRGKNSIHHTAAHLMLVALESMRPQIQESIYGAKIGEESARLDFKVEEKITPEEVAKVKEKVEEMITRQLPIQTYAHEKEAEALYWECDGNVMPCGGTHLTNTAHTGTVSLKRKNLGKGAERLTIRCDIVPQHFELYE